MWPTLRLLRPTAAPNVAATAGRHAATTPRVLTIYSKPDCLLCDEAKEAIDEALAGAPDVAAVVETVNVEEPQHADKRELYRFEIPVIHLDGRKIMYGRVETARLLQLLRTPST